MNTTSGWIHSGGATVQVKYKLANPASASDNEIVAAVSGKKIRVLAAVLGPNAAANGATFKSAATAIDALRTIPIGGTYQLPYAPHGWFETVAGEALNLALTGANACGVLVTYIETV
jgi:hypothetical protein